MGFIPEKQEWLSIRRPINGIHHSNNRKRPKILTIATTGKDPKSHQLVQKMLKFDTHM